jgi:ketosteroid isomerase-like protein
MVKDLFSSQRIASVAPTKPEPAKTEPAIVAKAENGKAEPTKPEPAKVEPAKVEPAKAEPAKPQPPKAAAAAAGDPRAQIRVAIEAWAKAWSAKNVKGYLAAYAPDFETPGGEARDAWEKMRTERITRPKSIAVSVNVQSVKVEGAEATAVIRQSYRSDTLKSSNTKTLRMVRVGDKWLIKQERAGG